MTLQRYDAGPETGGDDVLALHRNENLFVAERVTESARRLLPGARLDTYPEPTCAGLRAALARHWGLGPEHFFVGNGSDEVLSDLLHALRERHPRLGVLDVGFKMYPLLASRFGYALEVLPGDTFATGRIEPGGFKGLALIDSPNAITGATLADPDLLALASDASSFLIWDNVYGDYEDQKPPLPPPANVAFVRSFSKFYGLAGLRIGYCIAPPELVEVLLARKDPFNVNSLAQAMACAALAQHQEFEHLAQAMRDARRELTHRLAGFGFRPRPSAANFVLAAHDKLPGGWIQTELLKRGIAVRRFPLGVTENYIRITVPPLEGVERLSQALARAIATAP